jgi:P-type Ca2+ transporter type 2C
VMKRPPRDPAQPLLSRVDLAGLGAEAAVLTATTLAAHRLALASSGDGARAATVAFSALTTSQIVHALNCRAGSGMRSAGGNPTLAGVVGGTVAIQALATQLPLLRRILGVTPLAGGDWMLVGGAALASLGLVRLGRRLAPPLVSAV